MNTGKSVVYGWGVLLAAAGGSYLYVRQEIDERHRVQGRIGQKDTRVLTWDERLALDKELDEAKARAKEAGGAVAASMPTTASSTPPPPVEEEPHRRKSYIR